MENMRISAIGVPWYRREDYERIRQVMADGDRLPATFGAWLQAAQKLLEDTKADGLVPIKAHLDPDEFVAWCRDRGLNVDAGARMQFAAEVARAMYQDGRG